MALKLKKRDLTKYDSEIFLDVSGSTRERDTATGCSRLDDEKTLARTLVKELEGIDDDGPTIGFYDDPPFTVGLNIFENTTLAAVEGVLSKARPNGSTDTAGILNTRIQDYFTKRLFGIPGKPAVPGTKGGWFSSGTAGTPAVPAVPANPNTKKRIIIITTDGVPNSQPELKRVIVDATHVMTKHGLTKEDLCIVFIQSGKDEKAKDFLENLDNGLTDPKLPESKRATMDIVKCLTCEQVKGKSAKEILEIALDD